MSGISQGNSSTEILFSIGLVSAIFGCIVLHELGHAITAKQFNFKTRDITLLPIGGLARMEALPDKPWQEFLVAIMGPVVNLVIAFFIFIFLKISNNFPGEITAVEANITRGNFWVQLYTVNVFLALFNLIPAFPMDGGRVLRALLSIKLTRARATKVAAFLGQFIAMIFIVVGFFYNPVLAFIGLFILLGAQAEVRVEVVKEALGNVKVGDMLMRHFSILKRDEPLSKAVALLLDSQEESFIVKDDGEVTGVLSKKEIIAGLSKFGNDVQVEKVMQTKIIKLHEEDKVNDVIDKFSDGSNTLMPVFNDKEMVGVLNLDNINEFVQVQAALKQSQNNKEDL
jgi:Zn-dependent protease/predicted transcriptional regulator